ncbi:uncharacterized protein K02A2.6-like [Anoplophora glabripennis]|uniref:uncharacterized protein K02A2.6-like n=1 Tax=Anoplophora glabripennis TaxID=217634 RepID=UPI000873CF9B|nr:uncharacterized protein K02A2.6-like [Anoplophora glabripennis]
MTTKKNRYLLVLVDVCSKWTEAIAIPKMTPRILINFCEQTFKRWGYPEMLISDNGPTFKSNLWGRYLQQKYIIQYFSPVYHQRANPVERRNQELKKLLRIGCQQTNENRWDELVEQALATLRNRVNSSTGVSPSVALLGAPLTQPGEWQHPQVRRPVRNDPIHREERLREIRRNQEAFNRKEYPRDDRPKVQFRVGDRVLTRNPVGVRSPLGPPWIGPYVIVRVCGLNVYEVNRLTSQVLLHIDDLRPWTGGPQVEDDGEDPMHLPRQEDGPEPNQLTDPPVEEENSLTESDTDEEEDSVTDPDPEPVNPPMRRLEIPRKRTAGRPLPLNLDLQGCPEKLCQINDWKTTMTPELLPEKTVRVRMQTRRPGVCDRMEELLREFT